METMRSPTSRTSPPQSVDNRQAPFDTFRVPIQRPSILSSLGIDGLPTHDLASWFLRVSEDLQQWRQILMIDGPSALILCDFLQQLLSRRDEGLASVRPIILRLLQDVCDSSGYLPAVYWLSDLEPHHRRRIKVGGEATIFFGTAGGKDVAIRDIHPPDEGDWSSPAGQRTLKIILREIVTHWQLRDPNILSLLGVFCEADSGAPKMVLPYVPGGSALDWLKLGSTPGRYVKTILGITRGLAYLHKQVPPVIHGDLHPTNVMIGAQNTALLCDFGLSRIRHEVTRTRTNFRFSGRVAYLAPELLAGPDLCRTTEASDVYALAMTFLELGTLLPPFLPHAVANEFRLGNMIQDGHRPEPPTTLGGLPPPQFKTLWSTIEKMWAPAERRVLSSAEVYDGLAQMKQGHSAAVLSVAFSPDGKRIASSASDNTVRLWDAESGEVIGEPLRGHTGIVWIVAFSPDGKRLVSGSNDKTIRLWEAELGRAIGEPLRGHLNYVWSVAFSPDGGRVVVSGSVDGTIRLGDTESGKAIGEPLLGHSNEVGSVAFSPDGKSIVSSSSDKTIRLWDAESGEAIGKPLRGHSDSVWSVAFSPDGKRLVSGSRDQTLRLWDVKTGEAIGKPLRGHTNDVGSVAFSPDGTRIISGSCDETIRMWEAESGEPIGGPLRGHSDYVWSVALSPDGKRIVSGSGDETIRLWDADSGEAIGEPM